MGAPRGRVKCAIPHAAVSMPSCLEQEGSLEGPASASGWVQACPARSWSLAPHRRPPFQPSAWQEWTPTWTPAPSN